MSLIWNFRGWISALFSFICPAHNLKSMAQCQVNVPVCLVNQCIFLSQTWSGFFVLLDSFKWCYFLFLSDGLKIGTFKWNASFCFINVPTETHPRSCVGILRWVFSSSLVSLACQFLKLIFNLFCSV